MIRRGILALALTGALAACGGSNPSLGARLAGPTDVVPFRGITVNSPEPRQYLAVSSGRGNELRIVDLTNDRVVLGPTVVFPLAIPSEPRPVRLAAASLGDSGADLLVASSAGSATIELVLTWSDQNRIVDVYDLAAEAGAAPEVLALTAAPVPGAPGQARIVAALSGGKLVVIGASRAGDGSIVLARPAVVRDFGFDAVDLAVVPSQAAGTAGLWLFAATRDDLDPDPAIELFGVAQLEISGDPTTWSAVAIEARGPTRLVGAAEVAERVLDAQRPDTFQAEAPLRVYAALDPAGCGLDHPMNCGLVTLDPLTRTLAPDPSGQMDHRAPMPINGVPLDMTISTAPADPAPDVCAESPTARLLIAPGTGQRCTSALAAVTSSDGFVYLFDLARWGAPNEASILRSTTRVRVSGVTEVRPLVDPATDTAPLLGFWEGDEPDSVFSVTQPDLTKWFRVAPGFTPTERFHVGWQIPLPQLVSRGALVGQLDDGRYYLAAQAEAGRDAAGQAIWALGPRLADPANGVRVNDFVAIATTADATCAAVDGAFPETRITEVLPPDPVRFPGGAVVLAPLLDAAGQPVAACWETAVAQSASRLASVSFTLRASEHLIYGERLGYLGRPVKDQRFTLAWEDDANPALSPEDRAIKRKLRRFYYPGADKCDATTPCPDFGEIDPMAPGPVLSFRLGWLTTAVRTDPVPLRADQLLIDTQSGVAPMARKPVGSGALPLGIARVDRSTFIRQGDIVRFYVAYQDDQVYVFSPGESLAQDLSLR